MSLREALIAFLDHRREVLERRTKHRLAHIAERLEVLEGYLAVYLNIDKVIKIIRTEDEPKPKLMTAFKLNDRQAEAILNMRLRALRRLEEMQIREEHASLTKEQKDLKKLLGSDKLQSEKLIEEMKEVDAKFGLKTAARQAPHRVLDRRPDRRREDFSADGADREGADHRHLLAEALAALDEGPSGGKRLDQIPRGRSRAFLDPCRDDRQADDVRDRRAVLYARLLEACRADEGMARPSAASSISRPKPTSSRCSCTRRAASSCSPRISGHGFVTNEDEAVAMTRSGKKVMNVPHRVEAQACAFVAGDSVAVLGENRKLLIFPLGRSARARPRTRRDPAALQGRRSGRCARVHLEGRSEGRQRPHLHADRS